MAAFSSQIYAGEIVFDDKTELSEIRAVSAGLSSGYEERDWKRDGFCSQPFRTPVPSSMILSFDEIKDRIEEMEKTKTRLSDIARANNVECLNQANTNYCWANAPTYAVMLLRVIQGQKLVRLSPASIAAPIKNFQNVGGWGSQALEYIVEHGLLPQEIWPANAIDRRYNTAENNALRWKYQCQEWYECKPRNLQEILSLLCQRKPVPVGLNWWGHEVTAIDPVYVNGQFGWRHMNSWDKTWGEWGMGICLGQKAMADEAVSPVAVTPS